ncbi:MAG: CdaR family protein [Gemmatimonadales bacterium]
MSLRRALTADLPLKLTSLGLSVFLWFLAAGEEPASTLVPVDLTVQPPAGRTVVGTAAEVSALVSGPRRELLKLSAVPMHVTRVLPDTTIADEVRVDVGPGDVELPRGVDVHIQDIQPRSVEVRLDSTFQRIVPVRAVVRLPPETGHVLSVIAVVPGTVRLLGPRQLVERIDSARTVPLEMARADGPVEETLALDTSGFGRVRAIPDEVTIRVDVEAVSERALHGVPVRLPSDLAAAARPDPATVEVRVRGAASRLNALGRDSVPVVVDWSGQPPARVPLRVLAPLGVEATVVPDSITLVRRGRNG